MADLPLLIGASLGHFYYSRSCTICQQKKLHKNNPFILGILYNAFLTALVALHGANNAGHIETWGHKEKPVSGLPTGL